MKNRGSSINSRIPFFFTLLCAAVSSVQIAFAATITVMNTNDSGAGSLRQALADANDGDSINFDAALSGTITLTSGELLVNDSITISGPGANILAVDGNAASRVFHISSGKTVTILGLTIRNGHDEIAGGGIYNDHGILTVSNCSVTGNSATFGGGIQNDARPGGSATVTINRCTLSGNSATFGGGVGNSGTLNVNNSTISGNSASNSGGGIQNGEDFGIATLIITNSTVSGNSATTVGGGICNCSFFAGSNETLTIGETILNAGPSGANISNNGQGGTVTSLGYNLSSDDASAFLNKTGDQNSTDPMLGSLQNNGGPTFTHALLPGSSAIDAGDPVHPANDQRGLPRIVNERIDIGAFEVQPIPTPIPTPTPTPTPTPAHPTPPPHPTPRPH